MIAQTRPLFGLMASAPLDQRAGSILCAQGETGCRLPGQRFDRVRVDRQGPFGRGHRRRIAPFEDQTGSPQIVRGHRIRIDRQGPFDAPLDRLEIPTLPRQPAQPHVRRHRVRVDRQHSAVVLFCLQHIVFFPKQFSRCQPGRPILRIQLLERGLVHLGQHVPRTLGQVRVARPLAVAIESGARVRQVVRPNGQLPHDQPFKPGVGRKRRAAVARKRLQFAHQQPGGTRSPVKRQRPAGVGQGSRRLADPPLDLSQEQLSRHRTLGENRIIREQRIRTGIIPGRDTATSQSQDGGCTRRGLGAQPVIRFRGGGILPVPVIAIGSRERIARLRAENWQSPPGCDEQPGDHPPARTPKLCRIEGLGPIE
jgi:hypothetical protein